MVRVTSIDALVTSNQLGSSKSLVVSDSRVREIVGICSKKPLRIGNWQKRTVEFLEFPRKDSGLSGIFGEK